MIKFPSIELISKNTPLEKLDNINRDFEGVELYIKRDDLTGLAFGGNKGRKLEYLLADAQQQGAQIIITEGGIQSNHVRMTAAAARKVNMKPVLVLGGKEPDDWEGNLLLDKFLGAEFVFCHPSERKECMDSLAGKYNKAGLASYQIPTGGSTPLGALGYLDCIREIKEQEKILGLEFDYIVAAVGSGATHAGLLLGKYKYNLKAKIMAIAADNQDFKPIILDLTKKAAKMIDYHIGINEKDLITNNDYVGPGYGKIDENTLKVVEYLAQKEGIFLGPIYTGKAMTGVLDLLKKGFFKEGEKILFVHTGGTPELFSRKHVLNYGGN